MCRTRRTKATKATRQLKAAPVDSPIDNSMHLHAVTLVLLVGFGEAFGRAKTPTFKGRRALRVGVAPAAGLVGETMRTESRFPDDARSCSAVPIEHHVDCDALATGVATVGGLRVDATRCTQNVVVAIDANGSMAGSRLDDVKRGFATLVNGRRSDDNLMVISLSDDHVHALSDNVEQLTPATAGGPTELDQMTTTSTAAVFASVQGLFGDASEAAVVATNMDSAVGAEARCVVEPALSTLAAIDGLGAQDGVDHDEHVLVPEKNPPVRPVPRATLVTGSQVDDGDLRRASSCSEDSPGPKIDVCAAAMRPFRKRGPSTQDAIQPRERKRWHGAAASVAPLPRPPTSTSSSSPSGGVAPRGRQDGASWVKTPGSLRGCGRTAAIVVGQPSDAARPNADEPVVISCETRKVYHGDPRVEVSLRASGLSPVDVDLRMLLLLVTVPSLGVFRVAPDYDRTDLAAGRIVFDFPAARCCETLFEEGSPYAEADAVPATVALDLMDRVIFSTTVSIYRYADDTDFRHALQSGL